MKQFIQSIAIAATIVAATFSQPAAAAGKHDFRYAIASSALKEIPAENSFSVEVKQGAASNKIRLFINNPSKKNLYVSLTGPDGNSLDDFFTGKKQSEVSMTYNFSNADAGLYTIVVKYGTEKIQKQIKLEHQQMVTTEKLVVQE